MARLTPGNALQIEMEMTLCGLYPVEGYGMVHLQGDTWEPAQLWRIAEDAVAEPYLM